MSSDTAPTASSNLFRALFFLISLLVLAAAAYAGWVVVEYWNRVGV